MVFEAFRLEVGQRRGAGGAVGHDAEGPIDQALVVELLEDPPAAGQLSDTKYGTKPYRNQTIRSSQSSQTQQNRVKTHQESNTIEFTVG